MFLETSQQEWDYLKSVAKQFQSCARALDAKRARGLKGYHLLQYGRSLSLKLKVAPETEQVALGDDNDDAINH